MPGVKVITDSTSDLSPELISKYGITVIPYVVNFDSDSFQDGVDISTEKLFALVAKRQMLPKTAAPSLGHFRRVFEEALKDGSDIVYIGISSKFSSGTPTAKLAAADFDDGKVTVIDSANLSTGIGLQVLLACELAAAGKTASDIGTAVADVIPRVKTSFIIDTLDYLRMGGRCSGVQALVGNLLRIRPVISVVDGGMVVSAKVRGPRKKALDKLLDDFRADADRVVRDRVFVTHTGCHEDALYLMDGIRDAAPAVKEVLETIAGAVVASHCGPDTIGILYIVE
ncbi:MAG: DegV family protein [Firmicutes bacterium]|nr:DegV family protein [Bacillota bacterium]MDH7495318.1 DegV family protein [Bacillota bacterium]